MSDDSALDNEFTEVLQNGSEEERVLLFNLVMAEANRLSQPTGEVRETE